MVTIQELIERLQIFNTPEGIVRIYDGDAEQMRPITGMLFDGHEIDLKSDSDEEEEEGE